VELVSEEARLRETRRAFDRAAADYDGPAGNNAMIQHMRAQMWQTLRSIFPPGARLLDLGCGTGIDAAYLAARGYSVLATDWSPLMVERTRARITENGLTQRVTTRVLGVQDLHRLQGAVFDGIYSDLGPLNCAPDLRQTARACATLLRPCGRIVASVIGRICPWEIAYYVAHGRWRRAFLRWHRATVPVPLNGETVWTRYFTPRQFYDSFADDFALTSYRGLRLCAPPPYMLGVDRRLRPLCALGEWLDSRAEALPLVRNAGDHFLMIMTKRT
jgi:2-polyprenyl-3-methyl-5-hydroxy-6-metoxy-1,4-benzoquinol methylase